MIQYRNFMLKTALVLGLFYYVLPNITLEIQRTLYLNGTFITRYRLKFF